MENARRRASENDRFQNHIFNERRQLSPSFQATGKLWSDFADYLTELGRLVLIWDGLFLRRAFILNLIFVNGFRRQYKGFQFSPKGRLSKDTRSSCLEERKIIYGVVEELACLSRAGSLVMLRAGCDRISAKET